MANFWQNVSAFFDPKVAVNSDGVLVKADGFFDNGNNSNEPLDFDDLSNVQEFFYGADSGDGYMQGFNSSDALSDEQAAVDSFLQFTQDAAEKQNAASQSSADRAMEFEAEQAELNRQFQAEQAQKAMDYQTQMSNTAYQRAMADLQAAGINPKLVGKLGAASTPAGVAASGDSASGYVANMSMQNISAVAGVFESYLSSSASLTNKDKDFLQNLLTAFMALAK